MARPQATAEGESGVKLVRATGEALKTIEQYIVTINQLWTRSPHRRANSRPDLAS
jgi:hypothetical protein